MLADILPRWLLAAGCLGIAYLFLHIAREERLPGKLAAWCFMILAVVYAARIVVF